MAAVLGNIWVREVSVQTPRESAHGTTSSPLEDSGDLKADRMDLSTRYFAWNYYACGPVTDFSWF